MIELCYLKQGLGGNVTALFLFISPSWFSHSFVQNPWCGLKSPRNRFGFYLSVLFCLCVFFHFSSSQCLSFLQTALKHVIQNCLQNITAWTEAEGVRVKHFRTFQAGCIFFLRIGNDWIFDYIIFYLPMKFLLSKGCGRITES